MSEFINCQYCGQPRPKKIQTCPYCKPTANQILKNGIDKTAEKFSSVASHIATKAEQHEAAAIKARTRTCMVCNRTSEMKTWLGNHSAPQFIFLVLAFAFFIPALIFAAYFWGKYKCPACGAIGKNIVSQP